MRRSSLKLLTLVPTLALTAVVGAGFATWYFTTETSQTMNANVVITSEVSEGFTISQVSGANLYLDQATRPMNWSGAAAVGIYLSTSENGTDGVSFTVTPNATITTFSATLNWSAEWTGSTAANAATYLSLTSAGSISLTNWSSSQDAQTVTVEADTFGIAYVDEPADSSEYGTMTTALAGLGLKVTFSVTATTE